MQATSTSSFFATSCYLASKVWERDIRHGVPERDSLFLSFYSVRAFLPLAFILFFFLLPLFSLRAGIRASASAGRVSQGSGGWRLGGFCRRAGWLAAGGQAGYLHYIHERARTPQSYVLTGGRQRIMAYGRPGLGSARSLNERI